MDLLAPELVIEQRVAAHAAADFKTIYTSTHSASYFRAHFPDLEQYLEYARTHLVDQIRIEGFSLASVNIESSSAYVFAKAKYVSSQELTFVFEMHELQKEDGHWRLLASCRLPVTEDDFQKSVLTSELFTGQSWY